LQHQGNVRIHRLELYRVSAFEGESVADWAADCSIHA